MDQQIIVLKNDYFVWEDGMGTIADAFEDGEGFGFGAGIESGSEYGDGDGDGYGSGGY